MAHLVGFVGGDDHVRVSRAREHVGETREVPTTSGVDLLQRLNDAPDGLGVRLICGRR